MARKKAPISDLSVFEKQSTPLAQRLNELISDPNALKEHLGCSIQAINQYRLGISRPTLENLCKIADFYSVSTDYLLGRTQVKSVDTTIRSAAEYTSLSEPILSWLHEKGPNAIEIVEQLLQNSHFRMALPAISLLRKNVETVAGPPIDFTDEQFEEFTAVESKALDLQFRIIPESLYFEWQRHRIAGFIESAVEDLIPICQPDLANGGSHNAADDD